jgi:hypothetical protein
MKRTVLLLLVVTAAALAATAAAAMHSGGRGGALHVTKECSEYTGGLGEFCTITSSNVKTIQPGMKVFYLAVPGSDGVLDSDIAVSSGNGGAGVGHVLVGDTGGRVTLSRGSGRFRGFRAKARVSVDSKGIWHWDGTYSMERRGNH